MHDNFIELIWFWIELVCSRSRAESLEIALKFQEKSSHSNSRYIDQNVKNKKLLNWACLQALECLCIFTAIQMKLSCSKKGNGTVLVKPQSTIETTDICAMGTMVFRTVINLFEIIRFQPSILSEISTSLLVGGLGLVMRWLRPEARSQAKPC